MSAVRRVASNALTLLFLLLLGATSPAKEKEKSLLKPSTPASTACSISLDFDPETNVHAVDNYKAAVQLLFINADYTDIDCLADSARQNKEKFKGGAWKLHNIYTALDHPKGHATEEDWSEHFKSLQRWIAAKPESITPRIVLAESYISYAWDARGDGTSDTVSDNGWRLFEQRLDQAESTLHETSQLKTKCPEWYVAMQQVAQGKGWSIAKATALLEDAIAFEPDYYYFYRMHANYLLPKWYGEQGDTEKFIEATAERIGGEQGDMVYFQVASFLTCHCSRDDLKNISWPRIQRGFAALEVQTGVSLDTLNEFTYLAVKEKDTIVADKMFARIGDNWSEEVWRTEAYFKSAKDWVGFEAPRAAHDKAIHDEAEANLQTAAGREYAKQFEATFGAAIQKCLLAGGNENGVNAIIFNVDNFNNKGYVGTYIDVPSKAFAGCFLDSFNHQPPNLAAPPSNHYWLKIPLNPSSPVMANTVKRGV